MRAQPSLASGNPAPSYLNILGRLGLTTGLQLCLDPGERASYPGSGQTWTDRSGQGNDYFRGADNTATTDDPTFNGTAGNLSASEYFSVDGGDYFTQTADQSFADNWRQNNAAFSILALYYPPSVGSNYTFFENGNSGTVFTFRPTATNSSIGCIFKVGATAANTAITATAWNYCLVSYIHGAGAADSFFDVNGTVTTFDTSAMSTGTPSGPYLIGAALPNGARLGGFMIWNAWLTQAKSAALRTEIKARRLPALV
jgi:hypothetical protein